MYRANRGYPGTGGRFFTSAADLEYLSPNPEGSLLNPDPNPGFAPKKIWSWNFFFFPSEKKQSKIFYLIIMKDSRAPGEASSFLTQTRVSSSWNMKFLFFLSFLSAFFAFLDLLTRLNSDPVLSSRPVFKEFTFFKYQICPGNYFITFGPSCFRLKICIDLWQFESYASLTQKLVTIRKFVHWLPLMTMTKFSFIFDYFTF